MQNTTGDLVKDLTEFIKGFTQCYELDSGSGPGRILRRLQRRIVWLAWFADELNEFSDVSVDTLKRSRLSSERGNRLGPETVGSAEC